MRDPKRMCGEKVKHPTQQAALEAGIEAKTRQNKMGFVSAYKCPYCDFYHWGHKELGRAK